MAIKYGMLKNNVVHDVTREIIPSGTIVKFDDQDAHWSGYMRQGVFLNPIEESKNLRKGFRTSSTLEDNPPTPMNNSDGSTTEYSIHPG